MIRPVASRSIQEESRDTCPGFCALTHGDGARRCVRLISGDGDDRDRGDPTGHNCGGDRSHNPGHSERAGREQSRGADKQVARRPPAAGKGRPGAG